MNPTLQSLHTQLNTTAPTQLSVASQPAVVHQPAEPNWLERLLPTAGGVLGGIAGSFVSPFAGSVGGAALGGALGKAAENALTGQSALQANDLTSGAENALGQAAGFGVGKLAGGLLGKVGGIAAKTVPRLIQGQATQGALDSGTAEALRGLGITNLKQVGDIAPHVTMADGALNKGVLRGLTESHTGVDMSGLSNTAQNLIAENQMQLKGNSIPDVSNTVQKALVGTVHPDDVVQVATKGLNTPATYTFEPGALQHVLPENAFQTAKNFEKLASSARDAAFDKAGNVVNPDQAAKYKVFSGLADHIKGATFGGENPIELSAENKANIISELAPIQKINPDTYNNLVNQVTNAQSLQDLRPMQAPFVNANKALTATERAESRSGGMSTGDVIRSAAPGIGSVTMGPAGLAGGLALSALGTKAADRVGASTLGRVSDLLTNPTLAKAVQASAPVATQTVANAPNYVEDNQAGGGMTPTAPSAMPMGGNQFGTAPAASGGGTSPLELMLQTGLIGLQDPYLASNYAPLVNNAAGTLQKANTAQAALQQLEQTYGQAGGGHGLLSGLLARLGGAVTGGPANIYGQQAGQLQHQLTQMGLPVSAVPALTSTGPAAQAGFGTEQAILNSLLSGGGSGVPALAGI